MKHISFFAAVVFLAACNPYSTRTILSADYNPIAVPVAPVYEDDSNWAALPWISDEADAVAKGSSLPDQQRTSSADVFFVYPTLYTDEPGDRFPWNASVTDQKLNARIDEGSIRQQASIFNAAGRVFSPRYRQAHISAYYTNDEAIAQAAFDTAYADVKRAFEYFLANYNDGRPIIIAGHSQGTTHGKRLLREFFDGKPLTKQLVAAYLIGIAVPPDYFTELPVCTDASNTGCFVTWRTWQRPAAPWTESNDSYAPNEGSSPASGGGENGNPPYAVVVNPLTWNTENSAASHSLNQGGTLLKFKLKENLVGAQVHKGVLWIDEPKFFARFLIDMDNWHVADLNLFYENVRLNAVQRVEAFEKIN